MASANELMGLGTPPQLAALTGANPQTVTCAGTAQGTATAILSKCAELSAASSQTGAILPSDGPLYQPFFVFTSSSTSAVVYAPSGHTLNGSSNGSLTVAQNKAATFWQYKKGFWASILTA